MPTLFIINGTRFFFYSNENDEPMHIYVSKVGSNGKMWLEPGIKPAYFHQFRPSEVKFIMTTINAEIVT